MSGNDGLVWERALGAPIILCVKRRKLSAACVTVRKRTKVSWYVYLRIIANTYGGRKWTRMDAIYKFSRMICVQATNGYVHLRVLTFSYGYLRKSASVASPCEILKISKFRRLGAGTLRFNTDQLRTVTLTYDPADACVHAASTHPHLSAVDVTQRNL